jgi:AraC-like DNA-binding protein
VLLPGPDRLTVDVGDEQLRFRGFGFRIELFGVIELSGLLGLPLALRDPWPDLVDGVADVVRWGQSGGPAEALRARAHAELVTATLVEHQGDVRSLGRTWRSEVAAALDLMEEDPGRDLDVATLAAAVHLSPKHFSRTFKSIVGVPPMTYLLALRVSRARAALVATDRSVAAVAHDHGFSDAAHFSRAFRHAYGTTPRDFRARARARGLETSGRSSATRPQSQAG